MKSIGKFLLVGLIFLVAFFGTTALLDWICWNTGYYEEAATMGHVMDD